MSVTIGTKLKDWSWDEDGDEISFSYPYSDESVYISIRAKDLEKLLAMRPPESELRKEVREIIK